MAPGVGACGEWTGSEQGLPEALWSLQHSKVTVVGREASPGHVALAGSRLGFRGVPAVFALGRFSPWSAGACGLCPV